MLDISGERERAINSLRGKHLTKIGSGQDRTVYRINTDKFGENYNGRVVKYAKRPKAVKKNRKELNTWMAVKGTSIEENFCPIRDRSQKFELLVMDYARPASSIKRVEINDMKERLERNFKLKENIYDLYSGNFGYHNEYGLVVIDYPWGGNFVHKSRVSDED